MHIPVSFLKILCVQVLLELERITPLPMPLGQDLRPWEASDLAQWAWLKQALRSLELTIPVTVEHLHRSGLCQLHPIHSSSFESSQSPCGAATAIWRVSELKSLV